MLRLSGGGLKKSLFKPAMAIGHPGENRQEIFSHPCRAKKKTHPRVQRPAMPAKCFSTKEISSLCIFRRHLPENQKVTEQNQATKYLFDFFIDGQGQRKYGPYCLN